MKKPLVLCILDGVGISRDTKHNAVALAKMPFFKGLLRDYPHSALTASGPAVGLPSRTMGNSEVGHITIGSGRIVDQFLRRFEQEDLTKNKALKKFISAAKGDAIHILGLCSDGRVHSDINEAIVIAKIFRAAGLQIVWHFIADGRDAPPQSALKYIGKIKRELPGTRFGTLVGRYYAMDRNNNAGRTKAAFDAIAGGAAPYFADSIEAALKAAYARNETDEFIKPTIIRGGARPTRNLLFFNYRSDRARQIMWEFVRARTPNILCFSQYGEGLDRHCPALLHDIPVKNTLGDILAAAGKSQLRIAETEKYNHVTYFFDAERTIDFPHEKKILIPSPAVATFDLQPEMSAVEITDALLPQLKKFDVAILNYANGDMVGHTGNMRAATRAIEVLDAQLARLVPAVLALGGTILITADHGNAEKMADARGAAWTAHTTNRVPFLAVSGQLLAVKNGGLSDIAPTMLAILGIKQPKEMTGRSLL